MSGFEVVYAKYLVLVVKALVAALVFVTTPLVSTQAGDSHATATPPAHATPAQAEPAHSAPAPGEPAHSTPAHAEPGHDAEHADGVANPAHAEPTHGDASHDANTAAGEHHEAAEHGGEHGGAEHHAPVLGETMWGLPLGVWHAINFVVLFGAIFWFTRKALVVAVRNKRDATAKNIEEATRLREEMRKKFEDYDSRMKNIDERMTSIVSEAKTESEAEMKKMVAEAGVVAARIREDAKLIADQEIARAKRELQDEQIARASELAEQILKANITKEDQARLADEFMSRVGKEKEGRA